jgi:hypothetical protein
MQCYSVIFCGLLRKYASILRRAIELIFHASGSNHAALLEVTSFSHVDAFVKFAQHIRADPHQRFIRTCLREGLLSLPGFFSIRNHFRTSAYGRSVILFLA